MLMTTRFALRFGGSAPAVRNRCSKKASIENSPHALARPMTQHSCGKLALQPHGRKVRSSE